EPDSPNLHARMRRFEDERVARDMLRVACAYRDLRWLDVQGGNMRCLLDWHDLRPQDAGVLDALEQFVAALVAEAGRPDWTHHIDAAPIMGALARLHGRRPRPLAL